MRFIPLERYPDLAQVVAGHASIAAEVPLGRKWMTWMADARDASGHCGFLDGDWTIFPIYVRSDRSWRDFMNVPNGADPRAEESLERFFKALPAHFPETTALLSSSRRIRFAGFSRLHPHSSLGLHTHNNPDTRILHVALVVPPGDQAGLEVDGVQQIWSRPGDAALWNDNLPHRAWNDSDQDRIILHVAAEDVN